MGALELTPRNGRPYNEPDSWMRQSDSANDRVFITYLIVDDQDRLDVLDVIWLG